MRIRSLLILSFLIATLLPSAIFYYWSHRASVEREFAEVEDRHLLIARNIGFALERYQRDVAATFESASSALVGRRNITDISHLLMQLNMRCVVVADPETGRILYRVETPGQTEPDVIPAELLEMLKTALVPGKTVFSGVSESPGGENVIYLVRPIDGFLAIGQIGTGYFRQLGDNIAFGHKGHAAIVDQHGRVLAHPLEDWVASRKDISQISAVRRMMNGETGIEQFYSPAMKGDMIAGLTTVPGPGWGVMVPQPVAEIFDKVSENQSSVFLAIGTGLLITLGLGLPLTWFMARPIETLVEAMKTNARTKQLNPVDTDGGLLPVTEIAHFRKTYNLMVRRVTKAAKQIEKLAYTDTVTGLPNRDHLQDIAVPILNEAGMTRPGGIVVLVDIDNFKEVNDLHGHAVGDEFLKACAGKLLKITAQLNAHGQATTQTGPIAEPVVARIGGDEFIILVQGLTEESAIRAFLDDLRAELSVPPADMTLIATSSASIGCAAFPKDGRSLEEVIKHADIAMYRAKTGGKNMSEIYTPESGSLTAVQMRRDLLLGIHAGQLQLEYQPKVCSRRRAVIGVEALVRWNHPEHGRLMPGVWIPAITDSPAMNRLGEWVIDRAVQDQQALARKGHDLYVSVNIGAKHFISPGFVETLINLRDKYDINPACLEIEVTEDALFASEERAVAVFDEVSKLGYTITIDDFGRGYSNIARLTRLPVDILKVDRSIITGAAKDERIRAILASTLSMARDLGCRTVAEGIETLEQAEFVTRLGANCLQGYYFARAMPLDDLTDWLEHDADSELQAYQDRFNPVTKDA
jgi:diguanylate cyclase (GGDEF)-like protein